MQVFRFLTLDALAPLARSWDRLARGVPFRSWAWLSAWWRHYGEGMPGATSSLYVLGLVDRAGQLAGVAPWYLRRCPARGRVLRWLGSGEVCSEYLSVLCQPEQEEEVAESLADWLTSAKADAADGPSIADRWDLLELSDVQAQDSAVGRLADALEARGCSVHRRPGPPCWRIELPATWQHYLAMLAKDHRKQVRRIEQRLFSTGRAVMRSVCDEAELPHGQSVLVTLHQRRRGRLGQPGCFASSRFAAFHGEVMRELLRSGHLGLHWIELDGTPIAAEYHLLGFEAVYAYQSGMDPDASGIGPGNVAHVATIRHAIERGYRVFDFLRGDEPYKAHWRARPHAILEIDVVSPRITARLRHRIWRAGREARRWLRGRMRCGVGRLLAASRRAAPAASSPVPLPEQADPKP